MHDKGKDYQQIRFNVIIHSSCYRNEYFFLLLLYVYLFTISVISDLCQYNLKREKIENR